MVSRIRPARVASIREPVTCVADRRFDDHRQGQGAVLLQGLAQAGHGAGHQHGLGRVAVLGGVEGDRARIGRGLVVVVDVERFPAVVQVEQDAAAAAEPGAVRLHHADGEGRRHRGVDGVAALCQHLDRRLGGQRMGRGRDTAASGFRGRATSQDSTQGQDHSQTERRQGNVSEAG